MPDTIATEPHTSHPCARTGCTSTHRWVLTDPNVDSPMGYDGIRANIAMGCVLVEVINRTFGANTFDTEEDAIAFRARMLAAADASTDHPVGIDRLERAVPTPWGTHHRNA